MILVRLLPRIDNVSAQAVQSRQLLRQHVIALCKARIIIVVPIRHTMHEVCFCLVVEALGVGPVGSLRLEDV